MSYKESNPLPSASSEDAVVSIAAFETGWMKINASLAIAGLKGEFHGTSWRFFMQHAPSNTKFWFDLGVAHRVQHKVFSTIPAERDPAQDVISVGADPKDVKYIFVSHAHWDHIFPASDFFPNAKVLCHEDTLKWTSTTWPTDPEGGFDGRIWSKEESVLPIDGIPSPATAPEKWQPLGPFKNAHDFFGDGSFWLIDAPGHCLGNMAALARVKRKDGVVKWAFLGGDCFHTPMFVNYPDAPFGKGVKVTSTDSFHEDEEQAREIIKQAAELKKEEGENALIWLAHADVLEDVWNF
uniref:N-acyl homoserine lactonase AttM n=1 Tax=Talaromyces marneffei PM1 TaxID=1077442 RepID=A0A093XJN9_TALMA